MSEDFPAYFVGFRPGSLLAGYRLEAQVGAGGFAVVFRARDERLGRLVALKILAPGVAADEQFRRRFIAESRAAASVDDPHIIPVYEAGEASGVLFIAMRFVPGGDLRRVLAREGGALAPRRAAEFISPVASALDAAHRAGLVHRDVKPANILVDAREDQPDHVYLSDFGVSKGAMSSTGFTGTGHFLGTPDYSAPEQIRGQAVDGRTDQYALACLSYQLLTGTAPFERDQGMAVLLAHVSEPPPTLGMRKAGLPGAADQVLARGLAKVPEKRYDTCREFAEALREALGLVTRQSRGPASAPDHARPLIAPPSTEFSSPAGAGTAAVPAGQAAAATVDRVAGVPAGTAERGPREPSRTQPHGQLGGDLTSPPAPGPGPATPPVPGLVHRRAIPRRLGFIAAGAAIVVIALISAILVASGGKHAGSTPPPVRSTPPLVRTTPPSVRSTLPAVAQVRWTYDTGGQIDSRPAVADGTVYVLNEVGEVDALNAATGQLRWTHATGAPGGPDLAGSPSFNSATVAGGIVYTGNYGGTIDALNASTGAVLWTYATGGPVQASPAVADGTVYVGSFDHRVYALNASTGAVRWTYATRSYVIASAVVTGGTVYVAGADFNVYALDASNGALRWTYTAGNSINSTPAVDGGTVYVASIDHNVYALDAGNGRLRWTYTTGDSVNSSPTVADGTVYVGSGDGKLYALDAATGLLRWTYTTPGLFSSSPAVAGGIVYIGGGRKLYALDAATGRLRWAYTTAGSVNSSPTVADGTVYIGSDDHKVYALGAANP